MRLRDEQGQALVLALAFLMFFGLVIGAMLTFANASMFGTERLREQRSTVYAADSAVDAAIQVARRDPSVGAFGVDPCMRTSNFTVTAPDGTVATVTCTDTADPLSPNRIVTFSAMVGGTQEIQATVIFHDGVAGTGLPAVNVNTWTYCGHDAGTCP